MPHLAPIVIPSGESVVGQSLGFHAYSLRLDNLTNQWLQEESSLAWVPPYSLGTCLRLYGTAVAIILNRAPTGQPQLAPIVGEYTSGFFSDEYRTEVAGAPVRQFTLVQSVSDLTQGPQPALPPVGVDRLYADSSGNIHHLHSNGTDLTLVDPSNAGTLLYPTFDPHYQALMNATALGGDLYGTVGAARIGIRYGNSIGFYDSGNTLRIGMYIQGTQLRFIAAGGSDFGWMNQANSTYFATLTATGFTLPAGNLSVSGSATIGTTLTISGNQGYMPDANNTFFQSAGAFYFRFPAAIYCQNSSGSSWIPVNASAFTVQSMRSGKTNILPLERAIDIVAHEDLHGVSYVTIETGEQKTGFIADEWEKVVPEVCAYHVESNELIGMDYGAVSAFTFQALKDYMAHTDARLAALEGTAL
jgi:hypothetical protein